ncbi:cation diffusion facilitator family transporter [Tsuneonella amylolytica]|uniref:cation diffusion facilitator family transporter n=1 Tax=Tsuneonella amylolytica TaxID=2338327 RepID=UPI001F288128|nr:cation diffusion facilitator family transporter [Tsuneonella amylolytica]
MSSIIAAMYFTMGASKAMQSALIEDVLSLVPAVTWLVAAGLEPKRSTEKFPFGFVRFNSLAFLIAAVALALVGGFLFYESATTLLMGEHPTVPPVTLFGRDIWLGWLMVAALVYSIVPPVVLGRMKQPVAERLRDKVLHTDALMQKADWQTGLAGVVGVMGIGLGYWWADSAAALFIAISILKDGYQNIRTAAAELLDGAPRALESSDIADDARQLKERLLDRWPRATVRLRESGRYIYASVENVADPGPVPSPEELMAPYPAWRLDRLQFTAYDQTAESGDKDRQ